MQARGLLHQSQLSCTLPSLLTIHAAVSTTPLVTLDGDAEQERERDVDSCHLHSSRAQTLNAASAMTSQAYLKPISSS